MNKQELIYRFLAADDEPREFLKSVISRGDYFYASNGHIAVRIPKCDGIDVIVCDDQIPALEMLFTNYKCDKVLALPEKIESTPCKVCDGLGVIYTETLIGNSLFAGHYLVKILDLPGVKFAVDEKDDALPAHFIFDGGEGLLMPLRK